MSTTVSRVISSVTPFVMLSVLEDDRDVADRARGADDLRHVVVDERDAVDEDRTGPTDLHEVLEDVAVGVDHTHVAVEIVSEITSTAAIRHTPGRASSRPEHQPDEEV